MQTVSDDDIVLIVLEPHLQHWLDAMTSHSCLVEQQFEIVNLDKVFVLNFLNFVLNLLHTVKSGAEPISRCTILN